MQAFIVNLKPFAINYCQLWAGPFVAGTLTVHTQIMHVVILPDICDLWFQERPAPLPVTE